MRAGVRATWLAAAVWLVGGCGARTELVDRSSDDGGCALPRIAQDAASRERACNGTCTMSATSEQGSAVRFHCDGRSCQLFVDEVPGCVCTDLDFANVCSNGVPLCRRRPNFNFARFESVSCGVP